MSKVFLLSAAMLTAVLGPIGGLAGIATAAPPTPTLKPPGPAPIPARPIPSSPLPPAPTPTRANPAATPPASPSPPSPTLEGPDLKDVPTWSEMAHAILLTAIPDKYEDRKHWGKTREIFDGIQVQQRGFDIRVGERRRKVNDGIWYMFTLRFPNPEKNASILISNVESQGIGKFSFAIHVALKKIRVHSQFEQWILGVKGLNSDMESEVEVHMQAVVQMAIHTEHREGSFLPDFRLDPVIRNIRLTLVDVNTLRIGRVGGPLVEELGDSSRKFLEDLIHSQEGRVLKKANEAIQKKKDSLRVPASKLW